MSFLMITESREVRKKDVGDRSDREQMSRIKVEWEGNPESDKPAEYAVKSDSARVPTEFWDDRIVPAFTPSETEPAAQKLKWALGLLRYQLHRGRARAAFRAEVRALRQEFGADWAISPTG